jgi:hypothetical protein
MADDESGAAFAQAVIEIGETLEQKLRSRTGGVPPAQQRVVEAEDGDDPLAALESCVKSRVVAQSKIAPQPDDCRAHGVDDARPPTG